MPKVKSESNAKGNALCCVNIRKIRLYLSDPFRDTTRRPPPPPQTLRGWGGGGDAPHRVFECLPCPSSPQSELRSGAPGCYVPRMCPDPRASTCPPAVIPASASEW
jgi:hypothetical protein